ncbi:NAD(P)H-binding protein [Altererythrobacter soli]|uniref:NAD(P)H-binding protein n=1 Tax=Croceibacterium soli TaxID=1739690 RepID=A0A6I4UP17_9SPHN|nr:SDR family oxidoreductase [Croceibacterium soli]MXP40492.1 NAD(P)H-binding protein [Croceibacterium soli]
MTTYAVTGASGQLGKFVLEELLQKVEANDVVAIVRDPAKLSDYADKGIAVRQGDYDDPASLESALAGVDRLLLISGNTLGERPRQHKNVVDAAKKAGVGYMAYTSILKADVTPIKLGGEHRATEETLAESGLAYDLVRNGWYNENYVGSLKAQVEAGVITGAAGQGRVSSAARADYAAGAAEVLVNGKGGEIYELAGDESWSMEEFAAEVSRQAGREVTYQDMSEEEYAKSLEAIGLPEYVARIVANSNASVALGALDERGRTLSRLTGRKTTPIGETIAKALNA